MILDEPICAHGACKGGAGGLRVLMIDWSTPKLGRDAGSHAAFQEIRLLQSLGFSITFLPDDFAYRAEATERLQRAEVECIYEPIFPSSKKFLEARGREFDVVYITRHWVAAPQIEAIRQFAPQAKVILNAADLHFLREMREAVRMRGEGDRAQALSTRDDETGVFRKVDLVLTYSDVERVVIFSHIADATPTARCPWVVDVPEQTPPFEERHDVAFLGAFGHRPNVDAVVYFATEVMPLLRVRLPKVVFRIYGSCDIPDSMKELEREDVKVEGSVGDVAEVYNTCRVFVAPLLWGAGLKGKVIDALGFGTPSVLSPVAAEGTGVRHGLEALIAAAPSEWADSVIRLYESKASWQAMHEAARSYARAEYGFRKGQELMQQALRAVNVPAIPGSRQRSPQ